MSTYFGIKYALSSGKIDCFEGRPSSYDSDYICKGPGYNYRFIVGKTAFESRDDALAAVKAMRDKKVKSLEKQIAKLQAMTFRESV